MVDYRSESYAKISKKRSKSSDDSSSSGDSSRSSSSSSSSESGSSTPWYNDPNPQSKKDDKKQSVDPNAGGGSSSSPSSKGKSSRSSSSSSSSGSGSSTPWYNDPNPQSSLENPTPVAGSSQEQTQTKSASAAAKSAKTQASESLKDVRTQTYYYDPNMQATRPAKPAELLVKKQERPVSQEAFAVKARVEKELMSSAPQKKEYYEPIPNQIGMAEKLNFGQKIDRAIKTKIIENPNNPLSIVGAYLGDVSEGIIEFGKTGPKQLLKGQGLEFLKNFRQNILRPTISEPISNFPVGDTTLSGFTSNLAKKQSEKTYNSTKELFTAEKEFSDFLSMLPKMVDTNTEQNKKKSGNSFTPNGSFNNFGVHNGKRDKLTYKDYFEIEKQELKLSQAYGKQTFSAVSSFLAKSANLVAENVGETAIIVVAAAPIIEVGGAALTQIVPNIVAQKVIGITAGVLADVGFSYLETRNIEDPIKKRAIFKENIVGGLFLEGAFLGVQKTLDKASDVLKAAGAKKIPPEDVFDINVLKGEQPFPLAQSSEEVIKRFEDTRSIQKKVGETFVSVSYEESLDLPFIEPSTIVLQSSAPGKLRGENKLTRITTIDVGTEGNLRDVGFFNTPSGEGSPFFLGVADNALMEKELSFSLFPKISSPKVVRTRGIKKVRTQPEEVLFSQGFEDVNKFLASQAGSGEAFVTKQSMAGFGEIPADLTAPFKGGKQRIVTEIEAVLPTGSQIKKNARESCLGKIK
jgi:hypothetical protein